jgi:membrane associated rhomboid family serine protease
LASELGFTKIGNVSVVPLKDNIPTSTRPIITYGIIAINILVFGVELSLTSPQLNHFFEIWAMVPRDLTASFAGQLTPSPVPEWMTLFTSQFLHGGILHIAGNMLFLWIFGNNVEDQLGHIRYLVFYLACGALAALSQWFFSADSAVPSLGASGAIAGVMGAYVLRYPNAEILTLIPLGWFFWTFRIPAFFYLGFWFVQQAVSGVASFEAPATVGMEGGGIAYWAHAGGFVFGVILGPLLGLFSSKSADRF